MVLWIIFPITLSLVSFVGTWSVYGLALSNKHVCPLGDWEGENSCKRNLTIDCCRVPTISSSGATAPENSLFTATINAGSFLFLVFSIINHAHIMEKNSCHSTLSRLALVLGLAAAMGAFAAGNCNPGYLSLLHNFGAAISFTCLCFYTTLLTSLTGKCVLSGYERFLYPFRIVSTAIQAITTLSYCIFFPQHDYFYSHLSAMFEWMLNVNLNLFELSYAVEYYYFSSYMLSNLLNQRNEEKPLIMALS